MSISVLSQSTSLEHAGLDSEFVYTMHWVVTSPKTLANPPYNIKLITDYQR